MKEKNKVYDIVYFHVEGEEYFKEKILHKLKYIVFNPETDIKYTFFGLLNAVYTSLLKEGLLLIKGLINLKYIEIWLRKLRATIVANQIRKYRPKVVLTFTDNSNIFHLVCESMKEVVFLAVQNGGRHSWCAYEALPQKELLYHIDEYYCFGEYVKDLFEKHNHNIKKYVLSGSLLGGEFFSQYQSQINSFNKSYDICLVSQWSKRLTKTNLLPPTWRNLNESIHSLIKLVADYSYYHGKSVCVALRSKDPEEKQIFQQYFKGNCSFQESDRSRYSGYVAVTKSKLIVAINSTLATESFGAGMKVLFVNPFNERWLKPTTNSGIWYFTGKDFSSFASRLNNLIDMNLKSYQQQSYDEMKRSVNYDFKKPLSKILRKRLLKLIRT